MKRFLSFLLTLAFILTITASIVPLTASAESLYIRKIVSVVYDDSGSMYDYGEYKYAYASYAMQAFCGMLNSEDQLFITYMSDYIAGKGTQEVDLSAGGIQSSVDGIKNHESPDNTGTPFGAVEVAYEKLKSVKDSNPNTQYWLVVLTDGVFYEIQYDAYDAQVEYLDNAFKKMAEQEKMSNGAPLQITYMAIGSNVPSPHENAEKGIYTYSAADSTGIIDAMSEMADKVSGRTRLNKNDITLVDDKTIKVESSIPLLNIAVFAQKSGAVITGAVDGNGNNIPIGRKASLGHADVQGLNGGAFLLGNSTDVINSGSYTISFNESVDLNEVVVLFEPALEMRMTITLNGTEISDYSELDNAQEGDEVSVSCKIYEMGTDNVIDSSLLPPGTEYEIVVSEGGKVVESANGKEMSLSSYILKQIETEIRAGVLIQGFNPIERVVTFTPTEYVPKIVYTMSADFGSDLRSVKFDDITQDHGLSVCFTVYADGVPMEDPEAVKALNPTVTATPQGNGGDVNVTDDGKIVFKPNTATMVATSTGSYPVEVVCTLADGVTAKETYTVLLADYRVTAMESTGSVVKNEFYGNTLGVSFYITKDGVQLGKADVESGIKVLLNEAHSALSTKITVSDDGIITVVPHSEEEYTLTFWSWWINWWKYFKLSGEDVTVTLSHSYGSASSVIDVVEADIAYRILNVYIPLIIEILVLAFILWWIYAIIAKPKFLKGSMLYIGYLEHGGTPGNYHHEIFSFDAIPLTKYNKFKYRWKPTLKTKVHSVGKGISVSAANNGSILCHCRVWYKGEIATKRNLFVDLDHPNKVREYIRQNSQLAIKVLSPYDADTIQPIESLGGPKNDIYYVSTQPSNIEIIGGIEAIESGTIFAYAIQQNR